MAFAVSLASCGLFGGNGGDPSGKKTDGAPVGDQDGGITVGGYTVRLTKELSHGDMHFSAPEKAELSGFDQAFNIYYPVDEGMLFIMHLVYFKGQGVDEVLSGSENNVSDKTVGGVVYRCFEYEENGTPGRTYLYFFDGTTYTISFASSFDTALLEEAFLSGVRFEKSAG